MPFKKPNLPQRGATAAIICESAPVLLFEFPEIGLIGCISTKGIWGHLVKLHFRDKETEVKDLL